MSVDSTPVFKVRPCRVVGWMTVVLIAGLAVACAPSRFIYPPSQLREMVAERVPGISAQEVVVPFEVDPEHLARARSYIETGLSPTEMAEDLARVLFNPDQFGLVYEMGATATASETIRSGKGNCLSIASVYIGLARALGLKAYYMDFSHRVQEIRQHQGLVVNAGHVTAVVEIGHQRKALDLGIRFRLCPIFRAIDDLEVIAHYYNNRGYELIHLAQQSGEPIDWEQVAYHFQVATRIEPGFVRAWNNLGVASVRLDRHRQAEDSYRQAISLNPEFAAPYTNLGILLLSSGRISDALKPFRKAASLEPDRPHVHYHMGLALHRSGKLSRAVEFLEQAIDLKDDYGRARELLGRIHRQQAGQTGVTQSGR